MKRLLTGIAILGASLAAVSAATEGTALFLIPEPAGESLRSLPGIGVADELRLGGKRYLIAAVGPAAEGPLAARGIRPIELPSPAPGEALYVATSFRGEAGSIPPGNARVLASDRRTALLLADRNEAAALSSLGMELKQVMPPVAGAPPRRAKAGSSLRREWDPVVQEIIDDVDPERLWTLVGGLSGESPVTVGGLPYTILTRNSYSGNPLRNASEYCREYFLSLGLSVSYGDFSFDGEALRNVVAEQRGTVHPESVVVLCAHLDDRPEAGRAPGADDNASGCAAVLAAAAAMSGRDMENTVRYVLFSAEEQGLVGSYHYVSGLAASGTDLVGVINLDMIAWDGNGDAVVNADAGEAADSRLLGDYWLDTIERYSLPLAPMLSEPGWIDGSDHERFWAAGYPALVMIEDVGAGGGGGDFNPYYHTSEDTRARCAQLYFTASARAAAGVAARLAVPVESSADSALAIDAEPPNPAPGAPFTLRVRLTADLGGAFDFCLLAESPYGVYTVSFNGSVEEGIRPLFRGVPGARAPYEAVAWDGVAVPPGVGGTFTFYAVASDAGKTPPVACLGELSAVTPYVAAFAKKTATVGGP